MITHSEMVKALVKDGQDIKDEMTPEAAHIMHMTVGIAGEAGELLDAAKKMVFYNQELNRDNVIEELGDLEFFMEGLRWKLGITRQQCLDANIEKLGERYANFVYSDKSAWARADKSDDS